MVDPRLGRLSHLHLAVRHGLRRVQVRRFQSVVFALGVMGGIIRGHRQSGLVSSLKKIVEIATQALLIPGFLTTLRAARLDVHLLALRAFSSRCIARLLSRRYS